MTYFNTRINSTPSIQLNHLMYMYKTAGIEAPTKYSDIRALVVDTPEPHEVVTDFAARAYDSDDPAALVKEARKAITEAIAGDELKKRFLSLERDHLSKQIVTMKNQFRQDAAKVFNAEVKKFVDAANQLDPINPLDAEVALAQDVGGALTAVRAGLARFGEYASLWVVTNPNAPAAFNKVLPILGLPPIVREQVYRTLSEGTTTLNPEDAAGTLTIRQLGQDVHTNPDLALVNIARGHYPGVSLSLTADTPTLTDVYMQTQVEDKRGWV